MGHKKLLSPSSLTISANGAMSGTSTITSAISNIENFDGVGYDISWTGNPVGTISILASVTGLPGTFKALTFNPILAQPSGAAGGYLVSLREIPFGFVQVSYTNSSGAGTLSVAIIAKDYN